MVFRCSLRARYGGEQNYVNALHGSDSTETAMRSVLRLVSSLALVPSAFSEGSYLRAMMSVSCLLYSAFCVLCSSISLLWEVEGFYDSREVSSRRSVIGRPVSIPCMASPFSEVRTMSPVFWASLHSVGSGPSAFSGLSSFHEVFSGFPRSRPVSVALFLTHVKI